jgi:formylglycine-generating enzyme required for sulfatase activity
MTFLKIITLITGLCLLLTSCNKSKDISEKPKQIINRISYSIATPPPGMVFVKGGKFKMGDTTWTSFDQQPQHEVEVSSFYMDSTEITQKQYEKIIGFNPSTYKDSTFPVTDVDWYDAVKYCNELSKACGLDTVYLFHSDSVNIDFSKIGFRLPTEAEWEYACRAGTTTLNYWGDDYENVGKYEWQCSDGIPTLNPVAMKSPNPWRLYDMLSNASEWCSDWYSETYYTNSQIKDPKGPTEGKEKSIRGGDCGYIYYPAKRGHYSPTDNFNTLGFRCVLSAPAE